MEIYEKVFSIKNKYFERVFDTEENKVFFRPFSPIFECYIPTNKESKYKFILDQNINLEKKEFKTNKDLKNFIFSQETLQRNVYGILDPIYNRIKNKYFGLNISFKSRIWYLDIEAVAPEGEGFPEPKEAKFPVNTIQIYDNILNKKIILMTKSLNNPKLFYKKHPEVILKIFDSEKKLFLAFFTLIEKLNPCIITAWNGDFFDFPYLTNRAKNLGLNYRRLSPLKHIEEKEIRGEMIPTWEGLYLIDMMRAYKKFTYVARSSYSLDSIAQIELNEMKKVEYQEYKSISEFFNKNYDKFIEYAIRDIEILYELDQKLNLMELIRSLAYMMGINYNDTFGTVKPWGIFLTNIAFKKGLILPKDEKHKLKNSISGGYVAEPQKGLHEWEISFDANSLYPLLGMQAHNMSPETYIPEEKLSKELLEIRNKYQRDEDESKFLNEEVLDEISKVCKKNNVSFGTNGFFKNDKIGIIPEIVKDTYNTRKETKQKMLKYKTFKSRIEQELKERKEKIKNEN